MRVKRLILTMGLALQIFGCGPPPLSVTRPVNGEVLVAGTQVRIEWVEDDHKSVDILLSLPDGSTTTIASGIENTGSHLWSVPLLHTRALGGATLRVVPAEAVANRASTALVQRALTSETESGSGFSVGSFAALRWNDGAAVWEYYWTDVAAGTSKVVGTVGDLYSLPWPQGAAIDNENKRLFVVGGSATSDKVYTMNSITGEPLHEVALTGGVPTAIIAAQGKLFGFRWNDAGHVEEVVAIDPVTGGQDVVGTVGDLEWWTGQVAVDEAAQRIYALGWKDGSVPKIYTVDASTGAFAGSVPVSLNGASVTDLMGFAVNSAGMLIACRWNGTNEDLVGINPQTGLASVLGSFGDLTFWSGTSALNPGNDNFYVIGTNDAANFLYAMDAGTDTDVSGDRLLYKVGVAEFPTGGFLAY